MVDQMLGTTVNSRCHRLAEKISHKLSEQKYSECFLTAAWRSAVALRNVNCRGQWDSATKIDGLHRY